jgi:hypothetical protein
VLATSTATCAIVASERYVDEHGLYRGRQSRRYQSMVTDLSSTFPGDADA